MLKSITISSSALSSIQPMVHSEVVLVLPFIDSHLAEKAKTVLALRADHPGLLILVEDDLRLGFIMVANMVYAKSKSPYFGYLAQDVFPGNYWLKQGMHTLKATGSGLLAFNDGRFFGTLAVFGLVARQWMKSIYHNLLFYPQYKHHFADTEISAIAFEQRALSFNPNALLMEVDFDKHLKEVDPQDAALYRKRAQTGFDGKITPFEAP